MKEEKVKTQRCYLRKRRGVLCVDVVAECDRYVVHGCCGWDSSVDMHAWALWVGQ